MGFLSPFLRLIRSRQYWLGVFSCFFVVAASWVVSWFSPHCRCPDLLDAFVRNEIYFNRLIESIGNGSTVADEHGHYPVTRELQRCGVVRIWEEGGLVFFEGKRGWHDDPYDAIVKVREPESVYVSPLLGPHPNWVTINVQYVRHTQMHGWYYWCYDH